MLNFAAQGIILWIQVTNNTNLKNNIMKNFILPLLFISILTFTSHAQEVPETQESLITKITASWCGNCGTWGWSLFLDLIEDNADNALIIANHSSGDLVNTTSSEIVQNFNTSGQPRFLLNNIDQGASSGSSATVRDEIKNLVEANAVDQPVVNAGLNVNLEGTSLVVDTKTKFFLDASGEYYLSAYVIEDNLVSNQSGQGSMAVHKHILRTSIGDTFGTLLDSGDIASNSEYTNQFSMDIPATWNADELEIALIIWKKVDDTYEYVNSNSTTEFNTEVSSSIKDLAIEGIAMNLVNNFSNETQVNLDVTKSSAKATLRIIDQLGRTQAVLFSGQLATGFQQFTIDTTLPNGVYFVNLESKGKVITRQFVYNK